MRKLFNIFTIIILVFTPCVYAVNKSQQLHLVYPQNSNLKSLVTLRLQLKNNNLVANFKVFTTEIYAKKKLTANEYPYQYDVVELFLAQNADSHDQAIPYYELELSPFNQAFQAKIYSFPNYVVNNIDLGIRHEAHQFRGGWAAEIVIPLEKLGWHGGNICQIAGNAFAILGKQPRTYWSLYLPPQSKPNFHKPEYFKSLLCQVK